LTGAVRGATVTCSMGMHMRKQFLRWAVIPLVVLGGASAPANAESPPSAPFPWPPNLPPWPTEIKPVAPAQIKPAASEETPPAPKAPPNKKPPVPTGPDVAGLWKGELTQIGENAPYKVELAIGPSTAETHYPKLDCDGKLTRIGASKSYVFFIEIITKGRADKGGRCPDGTITMARSEAKLALLWFANIKGDTIIAYGALSK
jgi:hypothetical protein